MPTGVVTVTSTVARQAGRTGDVNFACWTPKRIARGDGPRPKWTAVTPVRFVPKICTESPPPVVPLAGPAFVVMLVMVGGPS